MPRSTDEDDLGLPENPIYSNYVKYLWKAHTRHGVQSPRESRSTAYGPQPQRVELPHAEDKTRPVTGKDTQ
jgi:hypothetical protein